MGRGGLQFGNRLAPPRFVMFLALAVAGVAARLAFPGDVAGLARLADALALGFDFAAGAFLLSLIPLLRDSKASSLRRHSAENDANRGIVLLLTTALTLVIMAAITGELPAAKAGSSAALVKLIGTLMLTWLFANTVYALHYAHEYYRADGKLGKDIGGLDFPATPTPDYLDFAYFAFTLGMTFQTSDVAITSRLLRRIVTLHSLAAFVFNIGVIAFTINAIGGL